MLVHLMVKNAATNFMLTEAKVSVDLKGNVVPEADTAVAAKDFVLFVGQSGRLHYYESPKGLGNCEVGGLYEHAAELCAKAGIQLTKPAAA